MSSQIDRPWASDPTWGQLISAEARGLFELLGRVCFTRRLWDAPRPPSDTPRRLQTAPWKPPRHPQDASKSSSTRTYMHVLLWLRNMTVFLLVCITYHEHSKYKKTSKTIGFYSMFALSSVLTLAYIYILIVPWPTLVFTSKIIQKWCPRRLQLVRKQITNTTWAPTGKKSRQGRPKKPLRRLQDTPGRLQDGSKRPPGRLQDGLKPLRNRARFLSRFRDFQKTLKNAPRHLQDMSRTPLKP